MGETLFDMAQPRRSRFSQDIAALQASLAWHAEVTAELQSRVLAAQQYLKHHSRDPELSAILRGKKPPEEA